jgi:DNA-directed RNA polymerase subunit RPC12/RpoP
MDAAAGSGDEDQDPDASDPRCPACGSRRAYRAVEPALPDAESETYVKLDADAAEDR